jgi:hypothetical protein
MQGDCRSVLFVKWYESLESRRYSFGLSLSPCCVVPKPCTYWHTLRQSGAKNFRALRNHECPTMANSRVSLSHSRNACPRLTNLQALHSSSHSCFNLHALPFNWIGSMWGTRVEEKQETLCGNHHAKVSSWDLTVYFQETLCGNHHAKVSSWDLTVYFHLDFICFHHVLRDSFKLRSSRRPQQLAHVTAHQEPSTRAFESVPNGLLNHYWRWDKTKILL